MDPTYLQRFLSDSSRAATRNDIRELLKLIARPEVISLAGGLPSPEVFPIRELAELLPGLIREHGALALQYGPTEGDLGLRRELIRLLVEQEGEAFAGLTSDHLLVTSASQQGLDLCARVFVTPGDVVICGLPSYLGALGALTACGAKLSGIPLDDEGMRTDLLEQRMVELRRVGVFPKFIYSVPDFQNPAGVTLSLRRRHELLAIARQFDALVVEDSPYRRLRYRGEDQPTLFSLDRDGRVISLFTFSKMLFPGLRLGWAVGNPEIISRLTVAKQPVDLCTSGLSQLVVREFLAAGLMNRQLELTRKAYAVKRDAMVTALERRFDPSWGVRWTRPEGGLFLWVELPRNLDAKRLLERALAANVAFVPGKAFHCDGSGDNTLRLNFSYPTVEQIEAAVARLAGCIEAALAESRQPEDEQDADEASILVGGNHALGHLAWNLALSEVVE